MVSRGMTIFAGVMFLVEGVMAFITNLNMVAAVLLILMGVGGIVIAFRRPRGEDAS